MKAGVIDQLGAAPHATTYFDPIPSTDTQVLVRIEAAALNAVDLHIASGHHRAGAPRLPYVRDGSVAADPQQTTPSKQYQRRALAGSRC